MASKTEPWRDCIDWLRRCRVLSPSLPCYSLEVLTQALRDGVLLCTLLDTLDPNCIDVRNVHEKPQMTRCLCLQNIKLFLFTCLEVFGMKSSDLFEPPMLFDFHDIFQVIYTLSKLSNTSKSLKHAPGFFYQKNQILTQIEICKRINIDEGKYSQEHRERLSYGAYHSGVRNEEIYQKLCAFKRHQLPQSSLASQHTGKRNFIIEELLESEIKYVMSIKTILECFIKPLMKKMSPEDIEGIFGEMQEIYDIHNSFRDDMGDVVSTNSKRHLSEVFLCKYHKFLIYGNYCSNISDAQNILMQKRKENPALNEEIMRCQESVYEGKFALEDLLILPFQRILKYPLLLERLIGDTQPSHEDYRGLEKACDAMKDVAVYINELKRDKEKLEALQKIEESIIDLKMPPNTTLKNYGHCLKDDVLRVGSPYEEKNYNRYVFLFDHVMLICKQLKDNKYSFQESLDLSEYKLKDCLPTARRPVRWPWYLIPESRNEVYMFSAKQEQQKKEWIKTIEDTLDYIRPSCLSSTDHQIFLKTFNKCTTCSHCKKSLKGLIFQGYWCKMCQMTLHKGCILPSGKCTASVRRTASTTSIRRGPIPPPPYSEVVSWSDYRYLGQYNWFVGEIEREEATNFLREAKNGTFLLRVRPRGRKNPNESSYALGLKTNTSIKHMIVHERTCNGQLEYYLSPARYFLSIAELVKFYEHSSLKENFDLLDTKLLLPYYQMSPGYAGVSQGESNEWSGGDPRDDYVDYDKENETKIESVAINTAEDFKDSYSEHNRQEESLSSTNEQASSFSNSATIYGSSLEESSPSEWQQWSVNENNWHDPPDVKAVGAIETPLYKKDRKSLGPSQSFPKTSAEENRRVSNLHIKNKRKVREHTKVVKARNPSFSKTFTSDFPRKEKAKPISIANLREDRTRSTASFQSTLEFQDKKSLAGSSVNGRIQLRSASSIKQSIPKSAPDYYSIEKTPPEVGLQLSGDEHNAVCGQEEEEEEDDDEWEEEEEDTSSWNYQSDVSTLFESKSLESENSPILSAPDHNSSSSLTVGTQTSCLDIPSSYDHIEIFGQFIVSELKTIQNKPILLELKKTIQNVVMQGIEKDNAT